MKQLACQFLWFLLFLFFIVFNQWLECFFDWGKYFFSTS